MKDALSIIVSSRTRLAAALALVAVLIAGGVTLGSWAVGSDPGNGYAAATTAKNLTLGTGVSAFTTGLLYPGGTGDVKVKVTNPNPFSVVITSIKGAGAITASGTCDPSSVTYTDQTGLDLALGAGSTQEFVLSNAAAMDNSAANANCQNATFTIPVTITATS